MKLYIAEKPSLGRAVADALPKPHRKADGCIYVGNGDVVSWCIGHLLTQVDPEAYDASFKQWKFEHLPIIPEQWKLKSVPKTSKQLSVLKKLIKQADQLVHVGDPDREGQLLVDEVIHFSGVKGAKLKQVERCLISDLTVNAVKRSLQSLRSNQDFIPLSTSALARTRADWLYGLNLTRAYTLLAQKSGYKGVISVGRVQTPLLGLVAKRDREIQQFVSKPFYEVLAHCNTGAGENFTAKWQPSEACTPYQDSEGRVLVRGLAENVANRITNQPAKVLSFVNKQKKQIAPLPYNLSSLQIDAAKRFGYSAQKVLDAAQALYERYKLITYPRSDSRYLPRNHHKQAKTISQAIMHNDTEMKQAVQGANLSIKGRAWNDSKVDAHHAIIPTDTKKLTSTLDNLSKNIYQLVVRQYLCQFYDDYHYAECIAEIEINQGLFVSKAKSKISDGWKILFPHKEAESFLPHLTKGQVLHCERGEVIDKNTQPPAYFTDATLLAAMSNIARFVQDPDLKKVLKDTDGLGTEATRAGIIELLFKRLFLQRVGKTIQATEVGRKLIESLPDSLTLPDMTALWEMQLNAISLKQQTYQGFVLPLQEQLEGVIHKAIADGPQALVNLPSSSVSTKKTFRKRAGRPTKNTAYTKNNYKKGKAASRK
ncbi:DNA topoisomerase III [Psychromonas sp. 14N.309.X.WAT.B.A12]|uniref:DNA topoisomerase III n=1 Tax=Psychromonas sp. 14N.309.X.WAT.B.A12 TaxID=2998322 RepID=UPI0025B19E7A|nr:DNA topoisomerase III [Psychromonas sp. 14N.309.X.WAT.B.A12]MDN2662557.1 DNA topoisomerase III [Psychromonas sp. 14N.309.X.WAT.B.A12]